MPAINVGSVLNEFKEEVLRCKKLVTSMKAHRIPYFQCEQISELSFLRVYVAWEEFLEGTFSRFLCGASSISGRRPKLYASPRNIDHARKMIIGFERGDRFADWSQRHKVTDRAELLFRDGSPFRTPIQAAGTELDEMRAIRDRIAHRSDKARNQFNGVVHKKLGTALMLNPGRFLLRVDLATGLTFLDFYSDRAVLVAENIVA
jgi:hypothetical protein